MRKLMIASLAAAYCAVVANLSGSTQSTPYQLEEGGVFAPIGGAPTFLSGTFEWAAPVVVYFPIFGRDILTVDALALNFQAGQLTLRLDLSPLNNCFSLSAPGPQGPGWQFCERVNAFDAGGGLIEPGLYLVSGFELGSGNLDHIVFPELDLYRNYESDNPELLGQMAFSAVAVPEPNLWILCLATVTLVWTCRHRPSLTKNQARKL